jgi:hypothetical protein
MIYYIDDELMNRADFMEYIEWLCEADIKKELRDKLNDQVLTFMGKGYGQAYVWKKLDPTGYELEETATIKRFAKRTVEDLEKEATASKDGTATMDYRLYDLRVDK